MGVQIHGAMTWLVESNPVDCVCIAQPIFLSRIWCLFCLNSPWGWTDWPIRMIIPRDDVASSVGSCHTVYTHTHAQLEWTWTDIPAILKWWNYGPFEPQRLLLCLVWLPSSSIMCVPTSSGSPTHRPLPHTPHVHVPVVSEPDPHTQWRRSGSETNLCQLNLD